MLLRDVELGDVEVYARLRCDPAMMAELGGPQPRDGIEAKVQRDVDTVASGEGWISMIVPDESRPGHVAGSVVIWSHDDYGEPLSEIGWMVLPEFQGKGNDATFGEHVIPSLHWVIDPATDLDRRDDG